MLLCSTKYRGMKQLSIIILFLSLLLGSNQSLAGVAVKKKLLTDSSAVAFQLPELSKEKSVLENARELVSFYKKPHAAPQQGSSGWEGITALICGILGLCLLFTGPLGLVLSILAIIFGALGLGRGKPHHGMALAGLILGAVALLLLLLAVIVFLTLLSWI